MSDATDFTAAFAELKRRAQPDTEPVLTYGDGNTIDALKELDAILVQNKRAQRWTASASLTLGTKIMPTVRMGRIFEVSIEGTTGSTEPSWTDEDEAEVSNGSVTFTESGTDFTNIYDVKAASQDAWALKTAKAAELISSSDSGSEQMIFDHCQKMAESYARPIIA